MRLCSALCALRALPPSPAASSPVFEQRAALPCLGVREVLPDGKHGAYVWKTFADVGRTVRDFASGLRQLGLNPVRLNPPRLSLSLLWLTLCATQRDRLGVYG